MAHVFISYAKKDTRKLALAIFHAINAEPELSAWMDDVLEPDASWAAQIQQEIDRADYVIVLLSPDVNRKETPEQSRSFVLNEIDYAQQDRKPILPVMAQRTRMPVQLAGIQYIDLTRTPNNPAPVVKRVKERFGTSEPPAPTGQTSSRTPVVVGLVAVAVLIAAALLLSGVIGGGGDDEPTDEPPTNAVAQQDTPRPTGEGTGVRAETPTLSNAQRVETAVAERERTNANATQNVYRTATASVIDATENAALATLAALSATPTPTPTLEPVPAALAAWDASAQTNDDWTPVIETFDDVEMVLVPPGSFEMGSTEGEMEAAFEMCQQAADNGAECQRNWFDDEAQNGDNTQTFTEPFWIDRYEVTRAQYQLCIDAGICSETSSSEYSTENEQPINRVTWDQANTYCEWREVHLPTEAEWEYAARGPSRWIFAWGDEFDGTLANHCDSNCGEADWASNFNYVNEENDDGFAVTSPVGSYPDGASWVGALDLSGNVWEWTSTNYEPYPYDAADGRENESSTAGRVVRGGSFDGQQLNLRGAARYGIDRSYNRVNVGFRCARPPSR